MDTAQPLRRLEESTELTGNANSHEGAILDDCGSSEDHAIERLVISSLGRDPEGRSLGWKGVLIW